MMYLYQYIIAEINYLSILNYAGSDTIYVLIWPTLFLFVLWLQENCDCTHMKMIAITAFVESFWRAFMDFQFWLLSNIRFIPHILSI